MYACISCPQQQQKSLTSTHRFLYAYLYRKNIKNKNTLKLFNEKKREKLPITVKYFTSCINRSGQLSDTCKWVCHFFMLVTNFFLLVNFMCAVKTININHGWLHAMLYVIFWNNNYYTVSWGKKGKIYGLKQH